jgi:hypothetical protein
MIGRSSVVLLLLILAAAGLGLAGGLGGRLAAAAAIAGGATIGTDELVPTAVLSPTISVSPTLLFSQQPAGIEMTYSLAIINLGTADLTWEIFEQSGSTAGAVPAAPWPALGLGPALSAAGGCSPEDVPWLSVNVISGTIAPAASTIIYPTFRSHDLDPGSYTASLCLEHNDPQSPAVIVPVALSIPFQPAGVLSKTVGLDPNICAAGDTITFPAGDGGADVTYCYTLTNSGDVSLTVHNLVDNRLGNVLANQPYDLAPEASFFLTQTVHLTQTTVNTATWQAFTASGRGDDPSGDTIGAGPVQLDVVRFDALADDQTLELELAFSASIRPAGTGQPNDLYGFVSFDIDQNPASGVPSPSSAFCPAAVPLGVEFVLDLGSHSDGRMALINAISQQVAGLVDAVFEPTSVSVSIPNDLLAWSDDGIVDLDTVIGTLVEPTDCALNAPELLTSGRYVTASGSATAVRGSPTSAGLSAFNGATTGRAALWLVLPVVLLAGGLLWLRRRRG